MAPISPVTPIAPTTAKSSPGTGTKILAVLGGVVVVLFLMSIVAVIGVVALISAGGGGEEDALPTRFVAGDADSENRILAIPVRGVILGENAGEEGGLFGSLVDVSYGYTIAEQLAEAADDPTIDAVVLEMDTPGGTIFGSRAINQAVLDYRKETGRPVLAHVRGISASGGMYSMAAADRILADHGTLIGSIGVIIGPFMQYEDVVAIDGGILDGGVETQGGITSDNVTAGRGKDFGTPWRPMTQEERATLQRGVDRAYDEFVAVVAEGRGLAPRSIEDDLGALIFDEATAMDNGLIDGIADRDEAFAAAAELAGIGGQDWRAERLSSESGSLLSLFVSGSDDRAEATLPPGFCRGAPMTLAYHGDPRTLCALVATNLPNN